MSRVDLRSVHLTGGPRLQYAERGEGPAIVFLHGYSDSWLSFDRVLQLLPDGVRGLALSQRGHGDSDRPVVGYHIENFAADVIAFMDALDLSRAVIVGHSMGSQVAQEVALSRPDRVSRLVLVGAGSTFDVPAVRELEAAVRELTDPVSRRFAEDFQAGTVHRSLPAKFMDAVVNESLKLPARVWHAVMDGILAHRTGPRLGTLTMPALILWGDREQIAPRAEQERLRDGIRDSRLVIYEETGHALHWEQAEQFVDDLMAFAKS